MELLTASDRPPVGIINPAGASSFLIVGDHAGIAIPRKLGTLGLGGEDLGRHIACDIGIYGLGTLLAERLDAVFIHQPHSRLVIDCNRDPSSAEAIAEISDGTPIPGNRALDAASAQARVKAIHRPYHEAIAAELARRERTIMIALHSFTPVFGGHERPWDIGILHDRGETRFAHALLDMLREEPGLIVGDNEPYKMDATDYTIPHHAYPARIPYAEVEIRQDLIARADGQERWACLLAKYLPLHGAAEAETRHGRDGGGPKS